MFNSPSVFSALLKTVSPLLGIAGSLLQMIHERNRPLSIMKHPSLCMGYRIFLTHPCSNSSLLLSNMSMMDETPSAEGEGVLVGVGPGEYGRGLLHSPLLPSNRRWTEATLPLGRSLTDERCLSMVSVERGCFFVGNNRVGSD